MRSHLVPVSAVSVLVVDDEPAVLRLLDVALRHYGFAVRLAWGGEQAVEQLGRHRDSTDLVLLDVQMPGLDGPQTLALLREVDPDVPVVIMTGNGGAYTAEELLLLGAARVVGKPFASIEGLSRLLRQVARPGAMPPP
jgi:CheY-like chemotaxis protein